MTVDYLPIANGGGANVISQPQYVIDLAGGGSLVDGYEAGVARSNQVNKTLRQASMIAAAVANSISAALGEDVLDDGNLAALISKMGRAWQASGTPLRTDTGAANAYVVALSPVITAYTNGLRVSFRAANANTLASTLNAGGGAFNLLRNDGNPMVAGDVKLNQLVTAVWVTTLSAWLSVALVNSQVGPPSGSGIDFRGSSVPTGYLAEDGASYLRSAFPDLFTAIGTTYGSVDGTHFNVPDSRGRVDVGSGTGTFVETGTGVVSAANGVAVNSNADTWITGQPAVLSGVSGFGGTIANGAVFVVRMSAIAIRFATTLQLAQAQTPNVTITGTGNFTLTTTLTARTLATKGGEEAHAENATEQIIHTHTQNAHNHPGSTFPTQAGSSGSSTTTAAKGSTSPDLQMGMTVAADTATNQNTGGNAAMNNMQPYLVSTKCIKV